MRGINSIFIHCSYTKPSQTHIDAAEIRRWHMVHKDWADIGYHDVIKRDASIEKGRLIETPGAHALGFNRHSIGICIVGGKSEEGLPEFNFTRNQMIAMESLVDMYESLFGNLQIFGHRDVDPSKECPCFDVREWFNR
jgi:hypothetical protein